MLRFPITVACLCCLLCMAALPIAMVVIGKKNKHASCNMLTDLYDVLFLFRETYIVVVVCTLIACIEFLIFFSGHRFDLPVSV